MERARTRTKGESATAQCSQTHDRDLPGGDMVRGGCAIESDQAQVGYDRCGADARSGIESARLLHERAPLAQRARALFKLTLGRPALRERPRLGHVLARREDADAQAREARGA